MLDVHILVSHDTRPEWLAQCIGSVRIAAALADFPIDVHEVPAVIGHIGVGRTAGYKLGSHPYVTCVDDDDYLLSHAFSQMTDAIKSGFQAIFTPEFTLQNGHMRTGLKRHHLVAYRRRDALINHDLWPSCGDLAQINSIGADAIDLECPAYVHRLYTSKARVMRRSRPDELEMARAKHLA